MENQGYDILRKNSTLEVDGSGLWLITSTSDYVLNLAGHMDDLIWMAIAAKSSNDSG